MFLEQKISILIVKKVINNIKSLKLKEGIKMEGSLGAMFVFVFIICIAIIALILALESHRKNNE